MYDPGQWPTLLPTRNRPPILMSQGVTCCLGHSAEALPSGLSLLPPYVILLYVVVSGWGQLPGLGLPHGKRDWDVLQTCAPAIGNVIPILRSLVKGRG